MHVHVSGPNGEAKFWLEPLIALASHTGLSARELLAIQKIVEKNKDAIIKSWDHHFSS